MMTPAGNINPEILETDIVIVGGGGSGMAAAVAATEKGAKVTILECRRSLGGNTALAGGLFAAESHLQRRMRLDVRTDACFKEAMSYAHNKINPRIVRAYLNKSGGTIKWLENMGLKIYGLPPYYPGQTMVTWHCPKTGVKEVTAVLIKRCKVLGVELIMPARAVRLLADENGKITGVLAKRNRQPLQVNAGCVIIAAGGFGGNKQLLNKYSSSYADVINLIGLPHKGEGILMGMEAGAATEGLGIIHLTGPGFPSSRVLTGLAIEPVSVWVNKKGERFTDEGNGKKSFEAVNAQMLQPEMISFTLFDAGIRQYLADNGFTKGMGSLYKASRVKAVDWIKELDVEAAQGNIMIADSWDKIAVWIGIAPEALKNTIDEYNSCCEHGYDPVYGKERVYLKPLLTPPFYAMKCVPGMLGTLGGLKINEHMAVISREDKPIPGLFAAGSDTGGWCADTYNINLAGFTSGFAINSGRIAGESAADYIAQQKNKSKTVRQNTGETT